MTDYHEINIALKTFLTSLKELHRLGITTNKKDFTCQIGEWFVSELYGGQRADSAIQKYWDLKIDDKNIQVKLTQSLQQLPLDGRQLIMTIMRLLMNW